MEQSGKNCFMINNFGSGSIEIYTAADNLNSKLEGRVFFQIILSRIVFYLAEYIYMWNCILGS